MNQRPITDYYVEEQNDAVKVVFDLQKRDYFLLYLFTLNQFRTTLSQSQKNKHFYNSQPSLLINFQNICRSFKAFSDERESQFQFLVLAFTLTTALTISHNQDSRNTHCYNLQLCTYSSDGRSWQVLAGLSIYNFSCSAHGQIDSYSEYCED